jgi:hypothetical protein
VVELFHGDCESGSEDGGLTMSKVQSV